MRFRPYPIQVVQAIADSAIQSSGLVVKWCFWPILIIWPGQKFLICLSSGLISTSLSYWKTLLWIFLFYQAPYNLRFF